ncbi:MAG: zf-HC2 domain-containing protein [Burkholderiales bacterium]|nr:MAG: zf-HC2 domain-containing protein [Burkholderiales bacterium]
MKRGWVLIPCRQAHELLSERLDQPLSAADRLRLWLHLRICDACARVDQQLQFMRSAMRRLGQ